MKGYRNLLPYLALLGAWALFFWRFFTPVPSDRITYVAGDFSQQFGVFREVAYRSLLAGRLPLWADCLWSGYPFHADPQAQMFYPPMWLTFASLRLSGWGHFPLTALVAEVSVHYLFLSFFIFLFLCSLNLRPAAAVLGALTFTYGGYLTGYPPLQTAVLEVNLWLPLALLFAGRLAETRFLRDLALTALMLALAFLAGHPQTFLFVALLTLAYLAFRADQSRLRPINFIGLVSALTVLTAALSAVQLLPSVHFILNSTRASVPFEQAASGFPFVDVLQFFLPGVVSDWNPLYVGILPLGLAAFALSRPMPQVRFWAGAALVGLVLSFGARAAAYDAAYWLVPILRFFRGAERLALVVSFALAVLAAYGMHHLFGPLNRADRLKLNQLLRAGSVLLGISFISLGVTTYLAGLGFDPERVSAQVGVLTFGVGLALMALLLRARVPAVRRWVPAIGVSVAVLDLFAVNRPLNVVPFYEAFPFNPLLEAVYADQGFFRVQDDFQLPGHAGCAYDYRAIEGVTPYQIATYARFLQRAPKIVRWQLLGVKYVISWRAELYDPAGQRIPAEIVAQGSVPDVKGNVTKTFRLTLQPRRAFLAHQVIMAADEERLYSYLSDLRLKPDFDPFSTVFLPQAAAVNSGRSNDRVTLTHDVPGRITLSVASDSASVLVVSEAHFPGWRVTVDGKPAPVLRANGALLAVRLPSGAHRVEFVYRPETLLLGGVISVLALLLTFGFLLIDFSFLRKATAG